MAPKLGVVVAGGGDGAPARRGISKVKVVVADRLWAKVDREGGKSASLKFQARPGLSARSLSK